MAEYVIAEKSELAAIAQAVRDRTGKNELLDLKEIVQEIYELDVGPERLYKLTQIKIKEDGYVLSFKNNQDITGIFGFDENGEPESLTDDAGNEVFYSLGYPIFAKDGEGNRVDIIMGDE